MYVGLSLKSRFHFLCLILDDVDVKCHVGPTILVRGLSSMMVAQDRLVFRSQGSYLSFLCFSISMLSCMEVLFRLACNVDCWNQSSSAVVADRSLFRGGGKAIEENNIQLLP